MRNNIEIIAIAVLRAIIMYQQNYTEKRGKQLIGFTE